MENFPPLQNDRLLRAARGEPVDRAPVCKLVGILSDLNIFHVPGVDHETGGPISPGIQGGASGE